jgi:excisionase family DNA binding protein
MATRPDLAALLAQLVDALTEQGSTPAIPEPRPAPDRVLLTVEEAAEQLGIGRTTMFALIREGAVESVQIGRLRRVPVTAVQAYAARLVAEAGA